jgi:hypothetical protein
MTLKPLFSFMFGRAVKRLLDMADADNMRAVIILCDHAGSLTVLSHQSHEVARELVDVSLSQLAETAKAAAEAERATKQ